MVIEINGYRNGYRNYIIGVVDHFTSFKYFIKNFLGFSRTRVDFHFRSITFLSDLNSIESSKNSETYKNNLLIWLYVTMQQRYIHWLFYNI